MALIGSLSSGVSAMKAFSKGIEVIGSNIANINTTGFKESRADYSDTFSQVLTQASGTDGSTPVTSQVGTGSRISSIYSNFQQGGISSTGVITDLAISGAGFFKVVDPINNTAYATRAGNFAKDDDGYIVTQDGKRLQGLVGGSITYTVTQANGQLVFTPAKTNPSTVGNITANFELTVANGGLVIDSSVNAFTNAQVEAAAPGLNSLAFDSNGNLTFYLSNGDSFVRSKVLLMNFSDPNALVKVGNNLFTNFDAAGPIGGATTLSAAANTPGTNGLGTFQTEALELSNVDLTQEFANLITTQRSFQAASRIITVSDDILQEVVNLKR